MRRKNESRNNFCFEQLEGRRLLAADCAAAMVDGDLAQPSQIEMAAAELPVESVDHSALDVGAGVEPNAELATDLIDPVEAEPQYLDLSDGMDGFFGSLDAESPTQVIEFSTPVDGFANIVMASSFPDGLVSISVTDSNGDIVDTREKTEGAFHTIGFDANEGETYQLTIEPKESPCEGEFQVTVGIKAYADLHANEMGGESTELEWNEGVTEMEGNLESAGDVDTFRFSAAASGQVMLQLNELVKNDRVDLDIQVFDSEGNVIADGGTNEMLQISFDVNQGEEYFVSLTAGEDQTGEYRFAMQLESSPAETQEDGGQEEGNSLVDASTDGDNASIDTGESPETNPDVSDTLTDVIDGTPATEGSTDLDQPAITDSQPEDDEVVDADSETDDPAGLGDEVVITIDDEGVAIEVDAPQPETLPVPEVDNSADAELSDDTALVSEDPAVDSEIPIDDGSLITSPAELIQPEELVSETETELLEPELELVENVDSNLNQTDEATDQSIVCLGEDESVDQVFSELGALDANSTETLDAQFGPFNIFGGILNFWGFGTSGNNQQV